MTTDALKKEAEEYWIEQPPFTEIRDRVIDAYISSAEPREKRIAELEQENAELKELLEACKQERTEALYRNDKYIKENAELLEKLKNQKADYETYYKSCYNAQKKSEKQLTKAKEIIKNLMVYVPVDLKEYEEAKQFINSEVEK